MPNLVGKSLTVSLGVLTPPNYAEASLELSGYSFAAYTGATASITPANPYLLYAVAYAQYDTKGFLGELSGYSFTARCGAFARVTGPTPTVSASATNDVIARLTYTYGGFSLTASATTDQVATAQLIYMADYALTARTGATFQKTGPRPTFVGEATSDRRARVIGVLPLPTLLVSATQDAYASVEGTLPALAIAPSGVFRASYSGATILILASSTLTEYEAYSFTLMETKDGTAAYATHYTDYPFDRIVRFGDRYIGIASDGMYELGGDLYDDQPIVAVLQTPPNDFKQREYKRPISLYIGGRISSDFRATVVSAELTENSYNFRPANRTGARNYRIMFGKGIRARYLAYRLTNTDGRDFEVDDLTPEYVVSERRTA